MGLQDTARANRLHIGLFGKVNSGKSSLLNALCQQEVALVSTIAGTTTDPVYKAMELPGVGPIVWIDTAGFEDGTTLGSVREQKSREVMYKCDMALLLLSGKDTTMEKQWYDRLQGLGIPTIVVVNQKEQEIIAKAELRTLFHTAIVVVDAKQQKGMQLIYDALTSQLPKYEEASITGSLVAKEDIVLLVIPQDIQAPKGRLILPQVQTIRELLDKQAIVIACSVRQVQTTLASLKAPPKLIICDSQIFAQLQKIKPETSQLTSFSVLFAQYKGDITTFVEGAKALATLDAQSHVLIAEACTHAPLGEDIGRVKLPRLLKKKYGETLHITVVSGDDFPKDLQPYDLIIHCGACMFNKQHVMQRIRQAKEAGVPISNYGICIAYLHDMLGSIVVPK